MHTTSKSGSAQVPAPSESKPASQSSSKQISRRQFARNAAAIAAISASPATLLALPNLHSTAPPPAQAADNKSKLTTEQLQEVEVKLANIIRKYGDRLSEEQRAHLRRILSYSETMLAPIRAFPLKNSDSPATILKLSTGEKPIAAALNSKEAAS
jgi:hypothetical protein